MASSVHLFIPNACFLLMLLLLGGCERGDAQSPTTLLTDIPNYPSSLFTLNASGAFLYYTNNIVCAACIAAPETCCRGFSNLYQVDPFTGAQSVVLGGLTQPLSWQPGRSQTALYGVITDEDSSIWRINLVNGAITGESSLTRVAFISSSYVINSMAVGPLENYFFYTYSSISPNNIYRRDRRTSENVLYVTTTCDSPCR